MSRADKTLEQVLRGTSDAGIHFSDLCTLLRRLGFEERIRGDHHIFTRDGIAEIINLQPRRNAAKPYQVKQVRQLILAYRLVPVDKAPKGKPDEQQADPPLIPEKNDQDKSDGA